MKNRTINRLSAFILVVVLCLACSTTDDELDKGVEPDGRQDEMQDEMITVTIKNMAFSPANVSVKKGETVMWVNKDIVPHDVTDFVDQGWSSGTLSAGQSFKKVIEVELDYFCSIHPTMKGSVVLKE